MAASAFSFSSVITIGQQARLVEKSKQPPGDLRGTYQPRRLPRLSSGRPGFDFADAGRRRTVDRDPARLHRFRDFADQFDLKQPVVERGALDLNIVGQVELALERPRR